MQSDVANAFMEFIGRTGRMRNEKPYPIWHGALANRYPTREWRKIAASRGISSGRMTANEALDALLEKFTASRRRDGDST